MSQENLERILGLQLARDGDFVQRVRDDALWRAWTSATQSAFHPNFITTVRLFGAVRTYEGMDGFRSFWLDWLIPWDTYRIEIVQAIDCGDRALVLVRDFGRREPAAEAVTANNASVWTLDDGRIVRIDFYPDHAEALQAVGLQE